LKLLIRSSRRGISVVLKWMYLYTTNFLLYEPGNTNYKLTNNGSYVNIIGTVTRLQFVIPSRFVLYATRAYNINRICSAQNVLFNGYGR